MKKLIITLLIISLLLIFVLPWWGAEEEPYLDTQEKNPTSQIHTILENQ